MKRNLIKTVNSAIFIAAGIALPFAFHSIPYAGGIILPMHIPVIICGFVCGFPYGLICGALTPILSSFLTGMPPVAFMWPMVCELAVYGFISGLLYKFIRTKNLYADLYVSLIGAMAAGRVIYGVLNALFFKTGVYTIKMWATSMFITALPGIIIQLMLIPAVVISLEKSGSVSKRYPVRQETL